MQRKVLDILQPKDCVLAQIIRAGLLVQDKEYDKASEIYRLAAEAEKDNADLLLNQAIATEKAGHPVEALSLYRQVWQVSQNPVAANNAAYVVSQLLPGDAAALAEAQAWTEAAVKAAPGIPAFRDTKGWIAHLQGHQEEACLELRQAVKGLPNSPEVHHHLGVAEMTAGHNELARWHLATAVTIGKNVGRYSQLTTFIGAVTWETPMTSASPGQGVLVF